MRIIILILLPLLILPPVFAQFSTAHRSGEVLVQLNGHSKIESILNYYSRARVDLRLEKVISRELGIYLLAFNPSKINEDLLLKQLQKSPYIRIAQFNRRVYPREVIPNDPFYNQQWHMDIIHAPELWEFTTGGLTPRGDTIVVAVLDAGFDITQEDLRGNIWRNFAETPNDGIDNDNNGFVDDYWGWNTKKNNDDHLSDLNSTAHGTAAAGIIGAKGNNKIGVTGVNWNVKLMLLSETKFEDEIVSAYLYVHDMRQRYNLSNGREGAFVVATNFSLGINDVRAEDFPLWCSVYDKLGKVGILSVGSTTNRNVNVDQVGDMPTNCSSDYFIGVTSTNEDDEKVTNAGYGAQSIDLGAPGSAAYTTRPKNEYSIFPGTSAAAPHVTGAIGLLYSLQADSLNLLAFNDPSSTALLLKKFILDGVAPLNDLEGISTSGGRLDLLNSLEQMRNYFGATSGDLKLLKLFPNPASSTLRIVYESQDFSDHLLRVYNILGQVVYEQIIVPQQFSSKQLDITVKGWAKGSYFAVISQAKKVASAPFVVY